MRPLCLPLGVLAALPFAPSALSQVATASLRGVVADSSNAVVSGAEVVLTSLSTNQQRTQRSDAHGEFSFQELPIGSYRVAVRSPGFANYLNENVRLDVGNQSQIVVHLIPATTQQTIEVSAAAGIQTNEIARGGVVSERQIADLPMNSRNFSQLGILQPGVRPASSGLMVQGAFRRSGQNYTVNGQRPESNTFLLDGMRDVNRMDGGSAFRPPADAIAEFPDHDLDSARGVRRNQRWYHHDCHALRR